MYLPLALIATVGTWLLTAAGASTVFFFKKINDSILNLMLGFASGIMIAASFWSLLSPAISLYGGIMAPAVGFIFGGAFLILCDYLIMHFEDKINFTDKKRRIVLLISSITLHNIPEGLAVGVAFGALKGIASPTYAELAAPIAVAVGIGLQNFPEGAAISIPLRRDGYSRMRAFMLGQLSGIVEPVAGVLGALLVAFVSALLPYALSFAAGAMIFVVFRELIPEAENGKSFLPSAGCILGFTLMMVMDVAL